MHFTYEEMTANYFGLPTIVTRNPYEISTANFTVKRNANKLQRPVAGGLVETGSLKGGQIKITNVTNDTSVAGGRYFISHYDEEDI
ncbi:hypothetical protein LTR95_016515 [Oleoguttula sp. CCFEE 5521]